MKNLTVFRVVAAACVIGFLAAPVLAADEVSVGNFYQKLAELRGLPAGDVATAVASLEASGLNVPGLKVDKALTEGDVATIAQASGLQVNTSRPDAPFTPTQVDAFISAFGKDLGGAEAGTTGGVDDTDQGFIRKEKGPEPPERGKGVKVIIIRSPSEPE